MRTQTCLALLLLAVVAGPTHARNLQQSFSSASAVSTSGGSGPNGNCGSTSTVGNAQAFASGPPCSAPVGAGGAPVIPAPPPSPTCPTTSPVVNWGTSQSYPALTVCPGSGIQFKWNTQTTSQVFGLYQIPSATCPASADAEGVQLVITPASSPNTAGEQTVSISVPGTYYFTDIANCGKGVLQQVVVSTTASATTPAATTPAATQAPASQATAQAAAQATAGKKL